MYQKVHSLSLRPDPERAGGRISFCRHLEPALSQDKQGMWVCLSWKLKTKTSPSVISQTFPMGQTRHFTMETVRLVQFIACLEMFHLQGGPSVLVAAVKKTGSPPGRGCQTGTVKPSPQGP